MTFEKFDSNNPDHLDRTKYKIVKWEMTGRRPSTICFCDSFREDAARRDFSFNAMALTSSGEIIDHFNGMQDLDSHVVKTVGCPYDRFGEDFLRIIRAIRFAGKFNFEIDKCTRLAATDCADFINKVSIERIVDELFKMASLGGAAFAKCIKLLDEFNILDKFLPEITCMKNYLHAPIHHPEGAKAIRKCDGEMFDYVIGIHDSNEYNIQYGTVWDHTLAAVALSTSYDPEVNLAILFHDIGKPISFVKKWDEKNQIFKFTYHGHDYNGLAIFKTVCNRLKFSNDFKDKVDFCIANHMKAHLIPKMRKSKAASLLLHKYWNILKIVSHCDDSCRKSAFNKESWIAIEKHICQLEHEIKTQAEKCAYINGDTVMLLCNITPGPLVGNIITKARQHAIDNNITDNASFNKLIISMHKSILNTK